MKVLLTAFTPFLHHSVNSSEKALSLLKSQRQDFESLLLPVSFSNSFLTLKSYLNDKLEFDFILMMGQAKGRASVSLERVALNWMESKHPDNDGNIASGQRIIATAPDSYLVDFFPSDLAMQISNSLGANQDSPLVVNSLTAGSYVCNNLYFQTKHFLRESQTKILFVHLPLLPEQVSENEDCPSMDLHTQTKILSALMDLIVNL